MQIKFPLQCPSMLDFMKLDPRTAAGVVACAALVAGGLALAQGGERTGEQIVKQQCATCHQTGVNGAPRIDDRAAWARRMKFGLNATVRSATKGHGAMPARGGLADITDAEVRSAILYMFYPGAPAVTADAATKPAARDPNLKIVGGTEIYLGVMLADAVHLPEPKPKGRGYYHINITLRDSDTKAEIKDAHVQARVANPVTGGETKDLVAMDLPSAGAGSYGNYFRMTGAEPYTITVEVHRAQTATPIEAKFRFKR